MRFVVDAQLPPGLPIRLIQCGHTAEHVNGIGGAADKAIWDYALQNRAILVTKDEDFIALAHRNPAGPQVIWIRIGNISNEALWKSVDVVLAEIIESLEKGERIVEVI